MRRSLIVLAITLALVSEQSSAEVTFNGVRYPSMSAAIDAINGTVDPGWFTPERSKAMGDALTDIAAKIAGDLTNFLVASRAPGGAFGRQATDQVLNDQVEWLTRSAIQYLRNRPDNRDNLEKLMDEADVGYDDVDASPFQYRGAVGYFEYEKALLKHIQDQLTLQASSEGRSTIPNAWISEQIWLIDNALRDLQSMREIQKVPDTGNVDTQPPQATSETAETDVQEPRLEENINREEKPSNTSSGNGGMVNIGNEFLTHSSTISISIRGLGNEGYFVYLSIPPGQIDYGCPSDVSDADAGRLLGEIQIAIENGYLNLIENLGCNERRRN